MAAVAYPTVLLGAGAFGQQVVRRALEALDTAPALLGQACGDASQLPRQVEPVLEELLRAGRSTGERREPRLDLVLFCATTQVDGESLLRLCDELSRLVGERYGAMFPADRPPEQRGAALHLVIAAPRLTSREGTAALAQLAHLEKWAAAQRGFPLLSRVWLASQQTIGGVLTSEELEAACALFAVTLCASELRPEDVISRRLSHPLSGEGRVGFFSVASLDLPSAAIRRYAQTRAALDGLNTLIERAGAPVPDPAVALTATAALKHESWLSSLTEGAAASRIRAVAAELSGGGRSLPVVRVGPWDAKEELQSRHTALFQPGTVVRPLSAEDRARLDEAITALDEAESFAAADIQRGIDAVLTGALARETGLTRLAAVEAGLRRAQATLLDAQKADEAAQERVEQDLVPLPVDPLRAESEVALARLPSRGWLAAIGAAGGLGLGLAVAMATLSALAPSPPRGAHSAPVLVAAAAQPEVETRASDWAPWGVGLAVGLAAGSAWAFVLGRRSRDALKSVLERRRQALVALWSKGGGGPPQRQAEVQLLLRRRRVRRGALVALDAALLRLQALRRTLAHGRDQLHQQLAGMGVQLGDEPRLDDLTGLLGPGGQLHGLLVPPREVAEWVARRREVVEPGKWADRLLAETWPQSGFPADLPCADLHEILSVSEQVVKPLFEQSWFDSDELAAEASRSLGEWAGRAAGSLAPPCEPRTVHGDKVPGIVEASFGVAPLSGRQALEGVLRSVEGRLPVLWTPSRAARVVFVSTWEGYSVDQVVRGAGLAVGPGGEGK